MSGAVSTAHRGVSMREAAQSSYGMREGLRIASIGSRGFPSSYSGIETMVAQLYTRLATRGHRITIYCRARRTTKLEGSEEPLERVFTPALPGCSTETLSHNLSSVVHAVLRRQYDLIQLEAPAAGLFTRLAALRGVPVCVRMPGLDWQRDKWGRIASLVLRKGESVSAAKADRIIVVSRQLQDYFSRTYGIQAEYIPNGVDEVTSARVDPALLRALSLEPGRYFVCVGRLVPEKRVEDIILAFAGVDSTWRLVIVGQGTPGDGYVARLRALGAADRRILFAGHRERAEVAALYASAGGYVSASALEGLPLSVLECAAYGVPAVVSDIAPHYEILGETAETDSFYPTGDVRALRTRLITLLDNPSRFRAAAQRSRTWVSEHHSWNRVADRTEEVYRRIVQDHSRTARGRVGFSRPGDSMDGGAR